MRHDLEEGGANDENFGLVPRDHFVNPTFYKCPKCGQVLNGDEQFCTFCGWGMQNFQPHVQINPNNPYAGSQGAANGSCEYGQQYQDGNQVGSRNRNDQDFQSNSRYQQGQQQQSQQHHQSPQQASWQNPQGKQNPQVPQNPHQTVNQYQQAAHSHAIPQQPMQQPMQQPVAQQSTAQQPVAQQSTSQYAPAGQTMQQPSMGQSQYSQHQNQWNHGHPQRQSAQHPNQPSQQNAYPDPLYQQRQMQVSGRFQPIQPSDVQPYSQPHGPSYAQQQFQLNANQSMSGSGMQNASKNPTGTYDMPQNLQAQGLGANNLQNQNAAPGQNGYLSRQTQSGAPQMGQPQMSQQGSSQNVTFGQASQPMLHQVPHQQIQQHSFQPQLSQQGGVDHPNTQRFSLPMETGFPRQNQTGIQQSPMPGSQVPDMAAYPNNPALNNFNPNGSNPANGSNLGLPNFTYPNNPGLSDSFAPFDEPTEAFEPEEATEYQDDKMDILGLVASAFAILTIIFMCMPWVQMAAESINSLGEIAGSAVGAELHIEPAYPVWALLGLNDQISTYSGIASFFTAGNDIVAGLEVFKVVVFVSFIFWVVCICALASNAIRCAISRGRKTMGLFISACATSVYSLLFIVAYSQMSVMTEGATVFAIISLICSALCAASAMLSRLRII